MRTWFRNIFLVGLGLAVLAACGTPEEPEARHELTVTLAGDGSGSVTSDPAGIDTAAGEMAAAFEAGTDVTLTATATSGGFVGWSGDACDGLRTPTCTFTIGAGGASVTARFDEVEFETLVLQIGANENDAEEFLADSLANPTRWPEGYTYIRSLDLELGYDPQHGPQAIGLRFDDVAIPPGATVLDATLTFTAYSSPDATVPGTGSAGAVALTLTGEASTTSATFSDDPNAPDDNPPSSDITTRARTGASVAWTIDESWTTATNYTSPDVGSIVSEVIGLEGWSFGGALTFILEPTDASSSEWRRAYAHNADPSRAATLTIWFEPLP